jgi:hypothetical protein
MGKGMFGGDQSRNSTTREDVTKTKEAGENSYAPVSVTRHGEDHAVSDPSSLTGHNLRAMASGWEETVPQTDLVSQDIFMSQDDMENIISLDNEWREIYWQEPGIFESFGDGLWG